MKIKFKSQHKRSYGGVQSAILMIGASILLLNSCSPPTNFETPEEAAKSFLKNCRKENHEALWYLTQEVPHDPRLSNDEKKAERLEFLKSPEYSADLITTELKKQSSYKIIHSEIEDESGSCWAIIDFSPGFEVSHIASSKKTRFEIGLEKHWDSWLVTDVSIEKHLKPDHDTERENISKIITNALAEGKPGEVTGTLEDVYRNPNLRENHFQNTLETLSKRFHELAKKAIEEEDFAHLINVIESLTDIRQSDYPESKWEFEVFASDLQKSLETAKFLQAENNPNKLEEFTEEFPGSDRVDEIRRQLPLLKIEFAIEAENYAEAVDLVGRFQDNPLIGGHLKKLMHYEFLAAKETLNHESTRSFIESYQGNSKAEKYLSDLEDTYQQAIDRGLKVYKTETVWIAKRLFDLITSYNTNFGRAGEMATDDVAIHIIDSVVGDLNALSNHVISRSAGATLEIQYKNYIERYSGRRTRSGSKEFVYEFPFQGRTITPWMTSEKIRFDPEFLEVKLKYDYEREPKSVLPDDSRMYKLHIYFWEDGRPKATELTGEYMQKRQAPIAGESFGSSEGWIAEARELNAKLDILLSALGKEPKFLDSFVKWEEKRIESKEKQEEAQEALKATYRYYGEMMKNAMQELIK